MRFKLLILMMFGFCATALVQNECYAKKSKDYINEDRLCLKKAKSYDHYNDRY